MAIEGMVATQATGAGGRQELGVWLEQVKALLRSPNVRDETDYQFVLADDVDQTANVIDTAATHFLAMLVEQDSADAELDWVTCYDADSGTFDGTAALANTQFLTLTLNDVATDGTPEYTGICLAQPFELATGLSIGADGQDGTDPALDDVRVWVLYRN